MPKTEKYEENRRKRLKKLEEVAGNVVDIRKNMKENT